MKLHLRHKSRPGLRNGWAISTQGKAPRNPEDNYTVTHWTELAECQGKTEEFTIMEMGSPEAFALSDNPTVDVIRKVNVERITKALDICNTCVVKTRCLKAASEEDMFYTIRGGLWPTSVSQRGPGRPRKEAPEPPSSLCKHGHEPDWYYRPDSRSWRCNTCKAAQRKAKQAGKKIFKELPETCGKGHNDWRIYHRPGRNKVERQCRACYREAEAIRREKKAGMVQSEDGN